jgi:hypothetical protein
LPVPLSPFADIFYILENDLPENSNPLVVFFYWYALKTHVLSFNFVTVVDVGLTGLGDDVHPAVFIDLCAIFSNLRLRINSRKPALGLLKCVT